MIDKLKIEKIFPTTIGIVDYPDYSTIKDKWVEYINNKPRRSDGFSADNYQPHKDRVLYELNNWIQKQVNEYARLHKFAYEYEAKESWFIKYPLNDFQEWHVHQGYTISVAFVLESGLEEHMKTKFKSAVRDMKNPQNVKIAEKPYRTDYFSELTADVWSYDSVPGRLLIFRSHTEHSTTPNVFDESRIVFSYNFDPKE